MILINYEKNLKYFIDSFVLQKGNILLLFTPIEDNIKFCENILIKNAYIRYMPHWVKFNIEKINDEILDLIDKHINYLTPFLQTISLLHRQKLEKIDILNLSGIEIRIINLFILKRLTKNDFFEINIAGLSTSSIKLLFEFLIKELEGNNYNTTYLIIDVIDNTIKQNPVFIDTDNMNYIYDKFYKTNNNENFKVR